MTTAQVRAIVAEVPDPEVPVLTIDDLGILRDVSLDGDRVVVTITPTYSGCPAMDTIRADIVSLLADAGHEQVEVVTVLAPAWTTDWMSDAGRRKLEQFGIAPPPATRPAGAVPLDLGIRCPHCGSVSTREVSRFGSTACKSLHVCRTCLEPFDLFKAI